MANSKKDLAGQETESKKAKKTNRYFFNAAGEQFKRPTAGVVGFCLQDVKSKREIKREFSAYPIPVQTCAMAFGFMTSLGNTVGKADSDFEDAEARDEVFMNGEWAEAAEGGPRISLLILAIIKAAAKKGKELVADGPNGVTEKVKALDEAARKAASDDPAIAEAMAEIKLERAKEAAKAAKEAAKGSTSSVLDSF